MKAFQRHAAFAAGTASQLPVQSLRSSIATFTVTALSGEAFYDLSGEGSDGAITSQDAAVGHSDRHGPG